MTMSDDPGVLTQELYAHVKVFKDAQKLAGEEVSEIKSHLLALRELGIVMEIEGVTVSAPPAPPPTPVPTPVPEIPVAAAPRPMIATDIPLIIPGLSQPISENQRVLGVSPHGLEDPQAGLSDEQREQYIAQQQMAQGTTPDGRQVGDVVREAALSPSEAAASQASFATGVNQGYGAAVMRGMVEAEEKAVANPVLPPGFF